jgi:gamma-glutamylcyclotransferase (GGCT)/AIG2-like uncharacterized protein YtfP
MTSYAYLPLFVYGTLLLGQPAFGHLAASVERRLPGRLDGFVLYSMGEYPVAVPGKGIIFGEIYWLRRETFRQQMIDLEEYEGAEYSRARCLAQAVAQPSQPLAVWVFVGQPAQVAQLPLIAHGDWRRWLRQTQQPAGEERSG